MVYIDRDFLVLDLVDGLFDGFHQPPPIPPVPEIDAMCDDMGNSPRRIIPFWLSQYLWLIITLLLLAPGLFSKTEHRIAKIPSAQRAHPFNDSTNPQIFGVVSDLHIEKLMTRSTSRYLQSLDFLLRVGVDTVVLTGDLVNNFGRRRFFRYGMQCEDEFKAYAKANNHYRSQFKYFFDQPGNHDEFELYSFDSPSHYYRNYSLEPHQSDTIGTFRVHSHQTPDFVFVMVNPFYFPTAHALTDFWAHPTRDLIDNISIELEKHRYRENVFVFSHFPAEFWLDSDTNRVSLRFQSILEVSPADLMISGHLHPRNPIFRHYGSFLEVVGSDSTTHGSFSVVTIDNGCSVFHHIRVEAPPKGLITNPVPLRQLHSKSVFNEPDVTVRLLLFRPIRDADIRITGDFNGRMEFARVVNRCSIYTFRHVFTPGIHSISFEGDYVGSLRFIVGAESPEMIERSYNMPHMFGTAKRATIVLFTIMVLVLFPFPLPWFEGQSNSTLAWLAGEEVPSSWILATLGGAFVVRWRILTLPIWFRILLFSACIYPAILPIVFFTVEGHIGWMNAGGLFLKVQMYDVMGLVIPGLHLAFVVIPAALLASSLAVSRPWHDIVFFDFLVAAAGFVIGVFSTNVLLVQVAGIVLANLTSILVWQPLVIYSVLLRWRTKHAMDIYLNLRTPHSNHAEI
jgi:predicted MPP superfamily phosphohydrolase